MATRRDELKVLCENKALEHGYSAADLSDGLELLALELALHEDPFADEFLDQDGVLDLNEFHVGGKDDGGIDGLLFDAELTCLAFTQAKNKKGKLDASTLEEVRSFFNRLDEWVDPRIWGHLNEKVKALLDRAGIDPAQQEIRLYFVTSQTSDAASEELAQSIADSAMAKYADKGWNVSCHLFAQSSFLRAYRDLRERRRSTLVKQTGFKISPDYNFIFEEGDHRVLLCAVKGNEIRDLYMRAGVGEALFNANIRSALTSGKINPVIRRTAASPDEAPYFFLFNNGVTATCTEFRILHEQVTAENLQVVNGAQTVNALREALRIPNPDVYVLVRLIETKQRYGHKSELADKITRFQNTQNPVKASDFFSNDELQLWLRENLTRESGRGAVPAFWYENKRGVKPASAKGRKVTMDQLAQLRYACLEDAPFTYKHAKDIWDSQGNSSHYWRAFGSGGEAVDEWSAEEVAQVLWMIGCWLQLRKEHQEMMARKDGSIEIAYLGVLAKYVTALTYQGMLAAQAAGKFTTFRDLIGSKVAVDEIQGAVLKEARHLVRGEYRRWKESKASNPRLNMPRDDGTWQRLCRDLTDELKAVGFLP